MNPKVYSEVDFILENIEDDLKAKIPEKLFSLIKKKKLKGYISNIDIDKPLNEQELEYNTWVFLTMIYYNYWCESLEEKQELLSLLVENEKNN